MGFARAHTHLPLGIRSGGHGISGRSTNDGGLVIHVGALDTITVLDESARLVRIGPGYRDVPLVWHRPRITSAVLDALGERLGEQPSTIRRPGRVDGVVRQPGTPRDGLTTFVEK